MNNIIFKVTGMHCTGCAQAIQMLLQRKPGVRRASTDFDAGEARVLFDPAEVSEADLVAAIEKVGYQVTGKSAAA